MAVDLPKGWMRQIIGAASSKRPSQPVGCVGHFFDSETKVNVKLNLGFVTVRCPFAFRSVLLEDEPMNVLSWVSGSAVPNDELPEHGVRFFESGFYVIPGLTPTGKNKC